MRVLFWGTPGFAVPSLTALLDSSHQVVGVVTQPDRPRGRSGRPEPSAIKRLVATSAPAVPVLQPKKPTGAEFRRRLAELEPDVSVVTAYGNLLPGRVLELPSLGSLNVHASLLPRHRGAAPVAAALLAGDVCTGITLMRMDRGLDTGPILLQRSIEIGPDESCGELMERLARLGAEVLLEGLAAADRGELEERPQENGAATYAPRLTVEDARVDWGRPAAEIARRLRAYDPWPGAFTFLDGRRLKLFRGRVEPIPPAGAAGASAHPDPPSAGAQELRPGEVMWAGLRLVVATGEGALDVGEVQLEGRPRMSAAAFLRGRPLPPGARFG